MPPSVAEVVGASPTLEHFSAYFAGRLLAAAPGTADHATQWRNYVLATIFTHTEQPGPHIFSDPAAAAASLNRHYHDGLAYAALRAGSDVPEVAGLRMDLPAWRYQHRRLCTDMRVPGYTAGESSPLMLLGLLAVDEARYASLSE